jgi:hypothetical protein
VVILSRSDVLDDLLEGHDSVGPWWVGVFFGLLLVEIYTPCGFPDFGIDDDPCVVVSRGDYFESFHDYNSSQERKFPILEDRRPLSKIDFLIVTRFFLRNSTTMERERGMWMAKWNFPRTSGRGIPSVSIK